MKRHALAVVLALAVVPKLACDKIPGLGKKYGGDEGGAAAGGGALSFLGGTFEGEITMLVTPRGKPTPATLTFGIKSPKARLDMVNQGVADNPVLAQGGAVLIDPPAKKAYILMPAQKKAMVIDFEKAKAQRAARPGVPGQPGSPAILTDPPKVEKTGKKEVIAGYTCENWKVTSKTSRADMCVAEGIKWIDLSDLGMTSPEVALAAAAGDLNHFPLRVVAYDDKNVETTRMEATKIEKKKLDDARFVVPPDFQVIDMSAMLGNLQGLGAAGGRPGLPPGLPPGFVPPPKK
ncbi:hypothetical protein BH11MYX4_BH11MYX4_51710 [soil metagenome]